MSVAAVALSQGRAIDFGSVGRPAHWYQSIAPLANAVVLDMMSTGWTPDYHRALAAGQGVMLFQGYYSPAFAVPTEGALRGREMVAAARSVGLATGTTVWLDVESVPASVTASAMAAWINAWGKEVDGAGFRGGLYVGPGQPLSASQLYDLLSEIHIYWRSLSTPLTVATRGYALIQTQGDAVLDGQLVDWDTIQTDHLGGTVYVSHDTAASSTSPSTSATATDLVSNMKTLQSAIASIQNRQQEQATLIANMQSQMQQAGKLLQG